MLEIIYNTVLQKNSFFNHENNNFNTINKLYLSKSVFKELQKNLLSQTVEFKNISTENKKKDDKNIICNNFVISYLLNILNKIDKDLDDSRLKNIKNNNIQKKKMNHNKNIFLEDFYFLKNTTKNKIKNNKQNSLFQKLCIKLSTNKLYKNNNSINQEYISNMVHNSYFIKSNEKYTSEKINIYNTIQNNVKNVKHEKHLFSTIDIKKDIKNIKDSLLMLKSTNKIDNFARSTQFFKNFHKKESFKTDIEPFFLNHSKNYIEWKKSISQRILLSIMNKENQAEIYLKPENLGAIYIKINMKHDQATLNFISKNNEVRKFLDGYTPFLRDSLNKSGILLRKVNIYSSLKNTAMKSSKKIFNENIFNLCKLKKVSDVHKKDAGIMKCQDIDIYI